MERRDGRSEGRVPNRGKSLIGSWFMVSVSALSRRESNAGSTDHWENFLTFHAKQRDYNTSAVTNKSSTIYSACSR